MTATIPNQTGTDTAPDAWLDQAAELVESSLGAPVSLWDGGTGVLVRSAAAGPAAPKFLCAPLIRGVAEANDVRLFPEDGALCLLAIPLLRDDGSRVVATAPFVTERLTHETAAEAAIWIEATVDSLLAWAGQQAVWQPRQLRLLAAGLQHQWAALARARRAEREIELVTENLARTYEEISLLYTITQNLRLSKTDEDLGRLAIERLEDCLATEGFAVQFLPVASDDDSAYKGRTRPLFIASNGCPIDESEFEQLIATLPLSPGKGAYVAGDRVTQSESWQFPRVKQLIVVPLQEGDNVFGWLAAFNHVRGESFGTVEANLLVSLGTLLGIHCGNRELYRQQSELLQNMIRALVSAIDAKDPYTSGHSDRVARFAVRIALEMKCSPKTINTIYMAGLLHDVGKIGIEDSVLRKEGQLTEAEFEHIKQHPELGYKILADLKQLADVLPAVLYHHERWDGDGYPHGLAGEEIPEIARIMAVADSYDAMTSNRPYRRGLPDDTVTQIFRKEAGKYWDPRVVEAFFKAEEDIRAIAERERAQVAPFQLPVL